MISVPVYFFYQILKIKIDPINTNGYKNQPHEKFGKCFTIIIDINHNRIRGWVQIRHQPSIHQYTKCFKKGDHQSKSHTQNIKYRFKFFKIHPDHSNVLHSPLFILFSVYILYLTYNVYKVCYVSNIPLL